MDQSPPLQRQRVPYHPGGTTEYLGHVLHWSVEVKGPALLLTVVVGVDLDELFQVGVEHAVDDHTGLHGGDETDGCEDNGEVLGETHLNGQIVVSCH